MNSFDALVPTLDKAVATLIASIDPDQKRFIGELMLTAVAAYLIKRYADKYLEGLGYFDEKAKAHGTITREFLEKIRDNSVNEQSIDGLRKNFDETAALAKSKPVSASAKQYANEDIRDFIIESGAVRAQARDQADKVSFQAQIMIFGGG
jgi:hypothetical protein